MSQRVYLTPVSTELTALLGDWTYKRQPRARVIRRLAALDPTHQSRIAASARVVEAIRHVVPKDHEDAFLTASNCQPYFLVGFSDRELRELEGLRDEKGMVAFFVAQAEKLDVRPRRLPGGFSPPTTRQLEAYLSRALSRVERVLRGRDPLQERGAFAWAIFGRIAARLAPSWWQGRNHWLGALAHEPATKTRATTALKRSLESVAHLIGGVDWIDGLPIRGGAYQTTAVIPPSNIQRIQSLFSGSPWALKSPAAATFGPGFVETWKRLVTAALSYALRHRVGLLEGDELFPYAVRWPPLEA